MKPQLSVIQRLLQDISFDGAGVRRYRSGGLGIENVLTAEVLQGLDFLPRQHFFRAVVSRFNGSIDPARTLLLAQCDSAVFRFLPDAYYFRPTSVSDHTQTVNPDGIIETPEVFVLVEAKRIRSGSFQSEQLAREFIMTVREAQGRVPLLLLILGKEPPVAIRRGGKQNIEDAIKKTLRPVRGKIDAASDLSELTEMVHGSVAWITWQAISDIVREQLATFGSVTGASDSVRMAVERVAASVINAVDVHR